MVSGSDALALRYVLAADVGATWMRAAVVDLGAGIIVERRQTPTRPDEGIEEATERLADLLDAVRTSVGSPVLVLGVATAGPIDPRSGEYRHPPNLPGWHGHSMKQQLAAGLGVPVSIGHDAMLAAYGETQFGAHRGAHHLVYLTVSSGIGAGIIAGGRPVTGVSGGAGEAGHLIVNPGGRSCAAGCAGRLEGQASGLAIAEIARERLGREVTAAEVFALAEAGDGAAGEIVEAVLRHLGAGIASLLALLDPQVLILGGGVSQSLVTRWDDLIAEVQRQGLPRYAHHVPIELTTLDDDAGLLGAAEWAAHQG